MAVILGEAVGDTRVGDGSPDPGHPTNTGRGSGEQRVAGPSGAGLSKGGIPGGVAIVNGGGR